MLDLKADETTNTASTIDVLEHDDAVQTFPLSGVRLHLTLGAICICLFLITIEITIVNTALITIANDLLSFDRSSWIVTAYLLTYVGFLIIFSKLSDILGRKPILLFSIAWFTLWAGICGAAQTTSQLIIFRAFQGIGAAGVYSSCMIIVFELFPAPKVPFVAAGVSMVTALSLVLGPVLGGLINRSNQWRWVFLFNVPAGILTVVMLQFLLPRNFPNALSDEKRHGVQIRLRDFAQRIDYLGAFALLAASVFMVVALENAGLRHPWKSPIVAVPITISGILWLLFVFWERTLTIKKGIREPVFPWSFLNNRLSFGLFLTDFLLGPPSLVAIYSLPQRFQVVNGSSPLGAGIKLLPYTAVTSISSMLMSALASKAQIPVLYIIIFCSVCQTVGFGLLSYIPLSETVSSAQFGYQSLAAFGTGANMTLLIVMSPYLVTKKDAAIAQGAIGQFRYMGAVIGVAIVTCTLNSYVQSHLSVILSREQLNQLLASVLAIEKLPEHLQSPVRLVMAEAYNLQIRILMGFSAAQLVAAFLMWQRNQVKFVLGGE
ncbi:MFS multidrug transporter-like protein [Melanomma pulvis-pyrius CBS 109.77]|uniref:MFS multidrug transporter-like protein n=1 Tax=Melanomma pulvis-pyrius CBS 109.77 TaxID=1314802 RepID=A0A6A6WPV4_9PLEO|nr:MFS multidrug transporter-like protein [Melanomma pulvis-pyrius CBS 109.77]